MMAVELEDDAQHGRAILTQRELVRRGFILARRAATSVLRIDPALTIEREDVDGFLRTLEDVLGES
jgi:4-aminobutyrate aminotransferase-like enzyme